jgi:holo-[acyl-carrier protein] synthase
VAKALTPRVGHDLVEIERFRHALEGKEERWKRRIFTAQEWAQTAERPDWVAVLAVRFAAKEAAFKALRTGWGKGVSWRDVEVVGGGRKAPTLKLRGRAAELAEEAGLGLTVSLTHTDSMASAIVLAYPLQA